MNKLIRFLTFSLLLAAFLAAAFPASAQDKKNSAGESFFIISSIDQAKSQLLLKRPTEVTLLMHVNDKTQYVNEQGKPIHLADLRAGDTVWVAATQPTGDQPTATRIRKGPMSVEELHRFYLDYPEIK